MENNKQNNNKTEYESFSIKSILIKNPEKCVKIICYNGAFK